MKAMHREGRGRGGGVGGALGRSRDRILYCFFELHRGTGGNRRQRYPGGFACSYESVVYDDQMIEHLAWIDDLSCS